VTRFAFIIVPIVATTAFFTLVMLKTPQTIDLVARLVALLQDDKSSTSGGIFCLLSAGPKEILGEFMYVVHLT
jgi:hypothetical protein